MTMSIFRKWNEGANTPATIPDELRNSHGSMGKYMEITVGHLKIEGLELVAKRHPIYKNATNTITVTANPMLVPGSSNLMNSFEVDKGDDILQFCELYFKNYLQSLRKKDKAKSDDVKDSDWVFRIYAEKGDH